jgi:ComF family protein
MHQTVFKQIYNSLTSAFFPNQCLACGRLYHRPPASSEQNINEHPLDLPSTFHSFTKKFVCHSCIPKFSLIESPICTMCGTMFVSREGGDHVCGKCQKNPKYFTTARAAVIYDDLIMNAIIQFKYKGKTKLAKPLGRVLLFAFIRHFSKQDLDMVIPVPLYPKKIRQRGFNQVFLMIHDWETQFSAYGYKSPIKVCKNILHKSRHTNSQTGLNQNKRISNVKNTFKIKKQSVISGKNILLVDDVYTTGSTVNECARILKKEGANRIDVLTLARAT